VTDTSSPRPTGKRQPVPRSPRLLVVDDDPLIRLWLRQSLSATGYRVFEAEDELTAFEVLADRPLPDLILLDHPLGESTGFDVVTRLSARASNTPIVVMSADQAPDVRVQALAAGAFAAIRKPFEIGELTALLEQRKRSTPAS
jgi:DNA-binding response OmpR family regulator